MFTKLPDTSKAAIFSLLVLCLAVGAALLIRFLGISSDPVISFFIFFGMSVVWFALIEEIGMRGYLQPRLISLGRIPALILVGLVFATWHLPLIFLAPAAANFPTGSIWPATIAHAVHNAAWNVLGAVTLITAAPVLVDVHLVVDFGILILIGTAIGAI